MKKILALLLSLVLSLTSVGALADEGFTATLDFEWAPEELLALAAADLDEESAAAAQMILPVINQLDLQVVKENEQFQLSILAKNIPIASLTLGLQGNQIVIVSDLVPSYYLSVSMETLEALMAEDGSLPSPD